MPEVETAGGGKREFPYTQRGKRMAKLFAAKRGKPIRQAGEEMGKRLGQQPVKPGQRVGQQPGGPSRNAPGRVQPGQGTAPGLGNPRAPGTTPPMRPTAPTRPVGLPAPGTRVGGGGIGPQAGMPMPANRPVRGMKEGSKTSKLMGKKK